MDKIDPNAIVDIKTSVIVPTITAAYLFAHYEFATVKETEQLYFYHEDEGIWVDDGEAFIRTVLDTYVPENITNHKINEVIALLKPKRYVKFEKFTTPKELINLRNGVFDVKESKLLPHSSSHFFLYCLPISYDEKAECPRIMEFLYSISGGDMNMVLLLLEALGYPLMSGYPIQQIFLLTGNGSNGKSTFLTLLGTFLGGEAVSGLTIQQICVKDFMKAKLFGKLANIGGDIGKTTIYDTSILKNLTGGDKVSADVKFSQKGVDFRNTAKLYFSCNAIPENANDDSEAFYRRWVIINFLQRFTKGNDNKNIAADITTDTELSGLFNLVAHLILPILKAKMEFNYHNDIERTRREYLLKSDTAKAFIFDMLEEDTGVEVPVQTMMDALKSYSESNGLMCPTEDMFGKALKNSGKYFERRKVQADGVRKYYYLGLGVREVQKVSAPVQKMEDSKTILDKYLQKCPSCPICPTFSYSDRIFRNIIIRLEEGRTHSPARTLSEPSQVQHPEPRMKAIQDILYLIKQDPHGVILGTSGRWDLLYVLLSQYPTALIDGVMSDLERSSDVISPREGIWRINASAAQGGDSTPEGDM